MIYLLYNPLSSGGRGQKITAKLERRLQRKFKDVRSASLLEVEKQLDAFVSALVADDRIILIGGDGTLHRIVNRLDLLAVPCRLYLYRKGGSANDFARGHRGKIFDVTDELKDLPYFCTGDDPNRIRFLNGVGIGIDALVCDLVNQNNKSESYFKTAWRAFKTYRPYDLDIQIDGETNRHFSNVYFFVVMNGKYIGGGMKIAPHAVRKDEYLDLYVITSWSTAALLRIFPLVFLGWHELSKKRIHYFRCRRVAATVSSPTPLQSDGEVTRDTQELTVMRR